MSLYRTVRTGPARFCLLFPRAYGPLRLPGVPLKEPGTRGLLIMCQVRGTIDLDGNRVVLAFFAAFLQIQVGLVVLKSQEESP